MKISRIAEKWSNKQEGGVLKMMNLAWGKPGLIHLEVGEPSFATPPHVKKAAIKSINDDMTSYPPTPGMPELKKQLKEKVNRVNKLSVNNDDQIVVTNGGANALFSIFASILDSGDKVLVPNPGWEFSKMIESFGAKPEYYSLTNKNNFNPELNELKAITNNDVKAIVVNSPSNPLGSIIPEDLMKDIYDFCKERDIWLISDECYDEIDFSGKFISPGSFEPEPTHVISVYSFSKVYSMTGWRVGYCVVPSKLAKGIVNAVHASVMTSNAISQYAAISALEGAQDYLLEWNKQYKAHRDLVMDKIKNSKYTAQAPEGGFYVWLDISKTNLSSEKFALNLLEQEKVVVTPGSAFGSLGEGFIRISLAANKDDLTEGMDRIIQFK